MFMHSPGTRLALLALLHVPGATARVPVVQHRVTCSWSLADLSYKGLAELEVNCTAMSTPEHRCRDQSGGEVEPGVLFKVLGHAQQDAPITWLSVWQLYLLRTQAAALQLLGCHWARTRHLDCRMHLSYCVNSVSGMCGHMLQLPMLEMQHAEQKAASRACDGSIQMNIVVRGCTQVYHNEPWFCPTVKPMHTWPRDNSQTPNRVEQARLAGICFTILWEYHASGRGSVSDDASGTSDPWHRAISKGC
jgi:hypothetical protein